MATQVPTHPNSWRQLRFACACATAAPVASDPWAAIAKHGKLQDGTKEQILNALHDVPRTVTQLARVLGRSAPTVHRHIGELLASELVTETEVPRARRRSSVERHYRPAFPIVTARDQETLAPAVDALATEIADAFQARREELAEAFAQTGLHADGVGFESVLHYLFATAARLARRRLEAEGHLPVWPEHADGSRWVWWAEEPHDAELE